MLEHTAEKVDTVCVVQVKYKADITAGALKVPESRVVAGLLLQDHLPLRPADRHRQTPRINKNAGRNHWGPAFTVMLGGGGLMGGVWLWLGGGPPQHETWDPKPDAPESIRTMFGEVKMSLPGVSFGRHFPKLAERAHRLTVPSLMRSCSNSPWRAYGFQGST